MDGELTMHLFAFDRSIFNPRAGKMTNWAEREGWRFEFRLFGLTFAIEKGAR
jgi:hypothetical protein